MYRYNNIFSCNVYQSVLVMRLQVTTLREQMTATDEMFASDSCEVLCQVTTAAYCYNLTNCLRHDTKD